MNKRCQELADRLRDHAEAKRLRALETLKRRSAPKPITWRSLPKAQQTVMLELARRGFVLKSDPIAYYQTMRALTNKSLVRYMQRTKRWFPSQLGEALLQEAGVSLIGPAPAPPPRAQDLYYKPCPVCNLLLDKRQRCIPQHACLNPALAAQLWRYSLPPVAEA